MKMQDIFLKFACMCRIYSADVEADWLAFFLCFVSEGRPFLVRYRRGWFLSEQEAGREDGTLGKVRPDSVCVCLTLILRPFHAYVGTCALITKSTSIVSPRQQ